MASPPGSLVKQWYSRRWRKTLLLRAASANDARSRASMFERTDGPE